MRRRFGFFFLTALMGLSSCSVYRSAVRNEFENRAPNRLVAANKAWSECETLHPLQAWWEKEFPGVSYELLLSRPQLEVWKRPHEGGVIEIRSFEAVGPQSIEACSHIYESEADWQQEIPRHLEEWGEKHLD